MIFDHETSSRKTLLEFGVRVSLRKGTSRPKMETENRVMYSSHGALGN